jgi:hypothetical protein
MVRCHATCEERKTQHSTALHTANIKIDVRVSCKVRHIVIALPRMASRETNLEQDGEVQQGEEQE